MTDPAPTKPEKPRIALMGEFSAGKSTLTNLLIGRPAIPMKVTATQLPPVWLKQGTDTPHRIDRRGQRHPVDASRLEEVPLHDTAFIRLDVPDAEVLELCDIIDTPGISDPNMPPEIWQRAAAEADGVIWLTHATQAWRQSEAAVWSEMPEELFANSLLLVTRIDKLLNESDRNRVLARIRREVGEMFRAVLPISLTQATAANGDLDLWRASGGEGFSATLLDLIGELQKRRRLGGGPVGPAFAPAEPPPAPPGLRDVIVGPRPPAAPGGPPRRPDAPALRIVRSDEPAAATGPAVPRRVQRPVGPGTRPAGRG